MGSRGGSNKIAMYKWPIGGDLKETLRLLYGNKLPYREFYTIKCGSVNYGKLDRKTFFIIYNIIWDYDKENVNSGNETYPANTKACSMEARRNDITRTLKYSFACQRRRIPSADYWQTKTIMKDQTDYLDCGTFFVQVFNATCIWSIPGAKLCRIVQN